MSAKNDRPLWFWPALALGLACLLFVVALPALVQAAPSDLPPRPPTNTPVPTPTFTPTPTTQPPSPAPLPPSPPEQEPRQRTRPSVATIQLLAELPDSDITWQSLWTAVQWQDTAGRWHDVEGWRGFLDAISGTTGTKTWWVAAKDYGTGPFRWIVRREMGGERLGESELFYLPPKGGNLLIIPVQVSP